MSISVYSNSLTFGNTHKETGRETKLRSKECQLVFEVHPKVIKSTKNEAKLTKQHYIH